MQDPYCYPDSRVLKNKLNIHSFEGLEEAERRLAKYREVELLDSPVIGKFDFKHLQKIHAYLFQDIYDWAGKIRTVDIAKGNLFCRCFAIKSEANRIFPELKSEKFLQGLSIGEFCSRLAYYFAEINALHPFREGNGRTQREFIRQLAFQNNYLLNFSRTTKDEMVAASKASLKLDYAPLEKLLLNCLRTI
ncbi:Fic family protein [Candidatus Saccharibacteria bacterium]|nr:Fic family protein [Candidatus Saccharibacteria bacterium]